MDNYEPTQLQMATTDELIREVHARHPNMVVVFEKTHYLTIRAL